MTKAFGYIRCSGLSQMDGDGPVRQRTAIEKYALAHDIGIVGWFEESHTGSDLEGRIAFREMREALVSDGIRTVIVERLDRLARDLMIQETIIRDFQSNSVVLRSTTLGEDDLCSDDPTRVMIRQIMAAFYEYERKMIKSKLRAGVNRKRELTGRCEGRKPYGFMSGGPKQAEVQDPKEYPILQLIRDLHHQSKTPSQIAQTLNDLQLPSRHGTVWYPGVVRKILIRKDKFGIHLVAS
jgi:DNA invertase Pin-like site-specific DNA recombinase